MLRKYPKIVQNSEVKTLLNTHQLSAPFIGLKRRKNTTAKKKAHQYLNSGSHCFLLVEISRRPSNFEYILIVNVILSLRL